MKRFESFKGKAFLFLLFFSFLWFINFVGRTLFSPLLPLIEDEFRINHATAASIFIFQSAGYGISMFFSGILSGIFGYKKSIIWSLVISSLIFLGMQFAGKFPVLYFFSFIIGVSAGVYLPAMMPLLTSYYEERLWGKTISIHDSASSLGVLAAPIFAVFFLQFFKWRGIFGVLGLIFIISTLIFIVTADELKTEKLNSAAFTNFLKNKKIWIMSMLWAFGASCSLGVYSIIPLYLTKELHLEIQYANNVLGISRFGGFICAISAGFLASRFSLKNIMATILIISGIFIVLVSATSARFIGIALFLQASVIYAFFPAGLIAISRIFEANERSIATGFTVGFGVMIGWGVVPYLLGLSGDHLSFRIGLFILGLIIILSSGLVFMLKELDSKKIHSNR